MSPTVLVFVNKFGFPVPPQGEIPRVIVYAPPLLVADQRRFSDESMLNEKDMLLSPIKPWQLCVGFPKMKGDKKMGSVTMVWTLIFQVSVASADFALSSI